MRKPFVWKLKTRELKLGERTFIMGVLNVTPDSFSDGDKYMDPDRAIALALSATTSTAATPSWRSPTSDTASRSLQTIPTSMQPPCYAPA